MSSIPPFATGQKLAAGVRAIVFGLLMGGLAGASLIAAFSVRSGVNGVQIPVASATALLLLAGKPVADRIAAWMRVPTARLAAALAFLGLAPLIGLGALIPLGDPILRAERMFCGTGDVMFTMFALLAFPLFGATSALLGVVAANHAGRRVFALLRVGRLAALGLGVGLFSLAAIRAARKPDPDHYLASLPQIGVLSAVAGEPADTLPPDDERSPFRGRPVEARVHIDLVDGLRIRRTCAEGECGLSLTPGSCHSRPRWAEGFVDEKTPLAVSFDAKHHLWVVGRFAFRGDEFEPDSIRVEDVADELSPPFTWIVGSGLGLLIAAGIAFQRRRLQRRFTVLTEAKAGVHGQNGWIAFDESLPALRAAPDLGLPEGPVLVVPGQEAGSAGGAYRGEGSLGQGEILAGARDDLLFAVRGRIAVLDAFALTALLLTAAPLVTAACCRLLL